MRSLDEALTIWRIDLRGAETCDGGSTFEALAAEELSHARRMRDRVEAKRWLYAHAAMRSLLARRVAVPPHGLVYHRSAGGKPRVASGGGRSIDFNLTHSGAWAWLAMAEGYAVGIDLEHVPGRTDWRPLVDVVCAPSEAAEVRSAAPDRQALAFYRIWVRKEALLKGIGVGLGSQRLLPAICVMRDEAAPHETGDARTWWITDVSAPTGYVGAAATTRPATNILWRDWPFSA